MFLAIHQVGNEYEGGSQVFLPSHSFLIFFHLDAGIVDNLVFGLRSFLRPPRFGITAYQFFRNCIAYNKRKMAVLLAKEFYGLFGAGVAGEGVPGRPLPWLLFVGPIFLRGFVLYAYPGRWSGPLSSDRAAHLFPGQSFDSCTGQRLFSGPNFLSHAISLTGRLLP